MVLFFMILNTVEMWDIWSYGSHSEAMKPWAEAKSQHTKDGEMTLEVRDDTIDKLNQCSNHPPPDISLMKKDNSFILLVVFMFL